MLNSIQRTSNYQNSRPNFGMAIRNASARNVIEEIGQNLNLSRKFEELVIAAERNPIDVAVDISGKAEGVVLVAPNNVKIPDSFIPKTTTWLDAVTQGAKKAAELKPDTTPKPTPVGVQNEQQRLVENITAITDRHSNYHMDSFSQIG